MKATEMLHILKIQNKRLFIVWLATFIAFIGMLSYTIYLLNDVGVEETTQEIQDVDTIENSNINIVTLRDRLKAGLSINEALNKPVIKSGGKLLFTINNETKLLSEWCKTYNINYQTAWKKIKNGRSIEKALKLN